MAGILWEGSTNLGATRSNKTWDPDYYTLYGQIYQYDGNVNTNKQSIRVLVRFVNNRSWVAIEGMHVNNAPKIDISFYDNKYGWRSWGPYYITDLVGYENKVVLDTTFEVEHNNDGSLYCNLSVTHTKQTTKYYFLPESGSLSSGNKDLYTIARFPVLSFDSFYSELNKITCNLSNTRSGTMTKYQVVRISDNNTIIEKSCNGNFNFTLNELEPGTSYSGKYKVRAYANNGWGDYLTLSSTSLATKSLPIVSATNAYIDGSSLIQFNNINYISSYNIEVRAKSDNELIATIMDITTNNYNMQLSNSSIEKLLNKYTTFVNPAVVLKITITSNGIDYICGDSNGNNPVVTYVIPNKTEYLPLINSNNISQPIDTKYADTITGNNRKFIKGHNTLTFDLYPMNCRFGATGLMYIIMCGDASTTVSYIDGVQSVNLDNANSNKLIIKAVDSREKISEMSINIDIIEYTAPLINDLHIVRQNGIGSKALVDLNVNYTNWLNLKISNKIKTVEYRFRGLNESDFIDDTGWKNFKSYTANDDSIKGTFVLSKEQLPSDFSSTNKFVIELKISDELDFTKSSQIQLSTADVFIWKDIRNKYFGINKKPEKALDVNGDINGNTIYINGKKTIWYE